MNELFFFLKPPYFILDDGGIFIGGALLQKIHGTPPPKKITILHCLEIKIFLFKILSSIVVSNIIKTPLKHFGNEYYLF